MIIIKTPPHIFSTILWLSLLFLLFFFQGFWCNLFSSSIHKEVSVHDHHHHNHHTALSNNRKLLAGKFDFTPFLSHRHHHRTHVPERPESAGNEIDQRYGVEKRLVPTGPNPLHH